MYVKAGAILLFLLVFTSCAGVGGGYSSSSSVTLSWDESDSKPQVAGYRIYMGKTSGEYYRNYDAGDALTYTVKNLKPGTYYFVCTAYDDSGNESYYSNEVGTTID